MSELVVPDAAGRDYLDPALDLRVDPDGPSRWIATWGMKGCGKSTVCRMYFTSWPYDRLAIDPTRDFDPTGEFTAPWPGRWNTDGQDQEWRPLSYRYTPDTRHDPDWRRHLDDVIGHVLDHCQLGRGPVFLHVDEIIKVYKANHVQPAAETLLNEGRHYDIFQSTAGPRCVGVDPMSVSQVDDNLCWPMGILDRRRMADHAGVPLEDLEAAQAMQERHGFTRVTGDGSGRKRLIVYPPVPL